MTALLLALLAGVLFTCGALLLLQRGQIKVVLGLSLFTHAVNLTLFGTGSLVHGAPPILPHDADPLQVIATRTLADPLPQALILTAIVISFGVTAFLVVLVSRRDALTGGDLAPGELAQVLSSADPFGPRPRIDRTAPAPEPMPDDEAEYEAGYETGYETGYEAEYTPEHADDYDIFQYEFDEVYDRPEAEDEVGRENLPGVLLDRDDSQSAGVL